MEKDKNLVIHVPSNEDWDTVTEHYGIEWSSCDLWTEYKAETCILLLIGCRQYADAKFYEGQGYAITHFEDWQKMVKSKVCSDGSHTWINHKLYGKGLNWCLTCKCLSELAEPVEELKSVSEEKAEDCSTCAHEMSCNSCDDFSCWERRTPRLTDLDKKWHELRPEFDESKYEYTFHHTVHAGEEFYQVSSGTWETMSLAGKSTSRRSQIIRKPKQPEWKVGDGFEYDGELIMIVSRDSCVNGFPYLVCCITDPTVSVDHFGKSDLVKLKHIPHAELLQLAADRAKGGE